MSNNYIHIHMRNLYYILLLFVTISLSCSKNEMVISPDHEEKYTQYGVPFQNVPETADIVMYEVNLRAFSTGGDLRGVINRLDHIKELGVNVIWLMPIHPIGQINSVNSPYSVRDYKAVGAEFGTLSDLRALTDGAHERGMAVIMDWIANHTAWDHPWIQNQHWYTQDASGNIVHPPGTNWMDVADLNFNNTEMRLNMIDAMKFWAYEANVDGFRCDYADGVPFDFWKQAIDSLHSIENRKFVLFAEGTRSDHFQAGFDLNFGWQFYGGAKNTFGGQSANNMISAHNNEYNGTPAGKHWVRFTTNHDESAWDASPIVLFNGINGALAASVATFFTGGVPLIYSGQEVGTAGNTPFFTKSPINWNINPDMLNSYQEILKVYNTYDVARKGTNSSYSHSDVFMLKKSLQSEEILIIVNVRNTPLNFSIPEDVRNITWIDALTQQEVSLGSQIQLQAYGYFILKNS